MSLNININSYVLVVIAVVFLAGYIIEERPWR